MPQHPVIAEFKNLLKPGQVAVNTKETEHYRTGWRSGSGDALAVVFPHKLIEFWQVLEICVANDCIIIMQAANTGLTEGSTPSDKDYDRDIIVINTLAMNQLWVLGHGEQVISFPGTTLHTLEKNLKPLKRSPHSVIGSSCLGASIVGGIANNSGGALVKRGPAYTELSLHARVDEQGKLHLVNHLEIDLGKTPEEILNNLEQGNFNQTFKQSEKRASASDYPNIIRDVDADTPSRYNADPGKHYEASGCAGKIAVFAVRLDTFDVAEKERTYYIGTNHQQTLSHIRRHILSTFEHLPDVAEYMHRDIFDVSNQYGKDTFLAVKKLGTDMLPRMFALKGRIDAVLKRLPFLPNGLTDRIMQFSASILPSHLPKELLDYRHKYEHHLILKVSDGGIQEAQTFLQEYFSADSERGDFFECDEELAQSAYLNRFAAAGAAMRYQLMHEKDVGDMIALDIALRRNDQEWVEQLPPEIASKIEKSLYYGHFLCHVFHQDYILKKGTNAKEIKHAMLKELDTRGAKYPAEHNVGHLYEAEQELRDFYKQLDPTNTFNPGIGGTEKYKRNCSCCV